MSSVSSLNRSLSSARALGSLSRPRGLPRRRGRAPGRRATSSSALIICLYSSAILTFSTCSVSFSSFSKALRSSSLRLIRRLNRWVLMTMPSTPEGTSSESFFTSSPARPKIACSSFSSGVSSLLDFGRDLADQDVARLDVGADADDAVLVEVAQGLLRDVGDVAGELLAAELRLADLDLELLDVDRGVDVLLHQPLADDDRVLEVVAVPGHERDQDVAAQGQLALVGGGAVGEDLALLDLLARPRRPASGSGRSAR